jgi:PAS domain S-box-containing protein
LELSVEILPPWWSTWWFRAICLVVSVGLLARFYQWRFQQLQRHKKQLHDVINTVPVNVWSTLPDGAVDFINQRWQEFTGLPLDDALGWNWKVVIHPQDLSRFVASWGAALKDGQPMETEIRMRQANGEYRWWFVRNVPLRDELGNIVKWYGTGIDVEDRKRAEQAVWRSEKELRQVIETIPAMAFTALPDGSGTFVSMRWNEYTGLSVEDRSGSGWQAATHPEDLERYMGKWRISLATGQPFEDEARFRRASDGTYRWFLIRAVPLRDEQGLIVKWYGTVTDIDGRKCAEQERERLRQLLADLAHVNRVSMLGELVASLSHELKQPITATIVNANACLLWLKRDQPDIAEASEAVKSIVQEGNRATEIINHLRSFYKKGAATELELVDVNELIREMLVLLRSEANRSSICLRTDLAAELPPVTADRVQLQQVLMNLMLNGIEAMKDSAGDLTIKSELEQNGQLLISVSDLGVGLPVDKADQIFNAFFTTKPEGSGMGLAISRSIVESHGGRLWASANNGRGATFQFTLPTAADDSRIRTKIADKCINRPHLSH